MTTTHELAACGLPSEAEVDGMRRRLTDPERAGALWGRSDPNVARTRLDDIPRPSGMTQAARLYCVEETWRQGYSLHTSDGVKATGRMILGWTDAAARPEITPEAIERIVLAAGYEARDPGWRLPPTVRETLTDLAATVEGGQRGRERRATPEERGGRRQGGGRTLLTPNVSAETTSSVAASQVRWL